MEKKSIGRFIAALRKANGMTQKELAEQLNVSDKAVSRWERDESAPDLSLIPVIAEIFHVTSDEILRGERASNQENDTSKGSEKGKKQIAMLLEKAKNKFKMYSLISLGVAGAGLLGTMICNFGFLRASIGFFVGCIFYLAAIVLIGIALLNILPTIQMEEADENDVAVCKSHIMKWFYGTMVAVVSLFLFTLPLVTQVYDAYMGLNFDAWIESGLPVALVVAAVGVVFWWIISAKKFSVSEAQTALTKLKLKYVGRTVLVLIITLVIHILCLGAIDVIHPFAEGKTFYKYEEFIEFMEQDVPYSEDDVIYDELFTDVEMESVSFVRYGHIHYEEGEDMPITVYTHKEMRQENLIIDDFVNPIFMMVYIIEIATGIVFYFKARKKE